MITALISWMRAVQICLRFISTLLLGREMAKEVERISIAYYIFTGYSSPFFDEPAVSKLMYWVYGGPDRSEYSKSLWEARNHHLHDRTGKLNTRWSNLEELIKKLYMKGEAQLQRCDRFLFYKAYHDLLYMS